MFVSATMYFIVAAVLLALIAALAILRRLLTEPVNPIVPASPADASSASGDDTSAATEGSLVRKMPPKWKVDQPQDVEVRITLTLLARVYSDLFSPGVVVDTIEITRRMHVILKESRTRVSERLFDAKFETANNPVQVVYDERLDDYVATWRWSLTPMRSGETMLVVLYNTVDAGTNTYGKVKEKSFPVDVERNYRAIAERHVIPPGIIFD